MLTLVICCRLFECLTSKPLEQGIDFRKISEITEGFSGSDLTGVANTAISIVLHEYLQKYTTPEQAARHASDALVSMRHFEDTVKKIKIQREEGQKKELHLCHTIGSR